MSDKSTFQKEIWLNPGDTTRLLVYADVLDDDEPGSGNPVRNIVNNIQKMQWGKRVKPYDVEPFVLRSAVRAVEPERDKIDLLTPFELKMLPWFARSWLKAGLSTGPVDREFAKWACDMSYSKAGFESPNLMVWLNGPFHGCIGAHLLTRVQELIPALGDQVMAHVRDHVRTQVWDQVWDQVGAHVRDQVWAQVGVHVRDQVWDQIGDQVRDQVRDQVASQVRAHVGDHVRAQVWGQIGDQVRDQVRDQVVSQVGAQVGAHVRDQVWGQIGDQVRDQVRDQVVSQVGAQVGAHVRDQVASRVGSQVGSQVWDQVRAQVRDQVGDQVRDQVGDQESVSQIQDQRWRCGYGCQDAGWLSFYCAMSAFGLTTCADRLVGLFALSQCGWWWPFKGAILFTERPTELVMKNKKLVSFKYADGLEYSTKPAKATA